MWGMIQEHSGVTDSFFITFDLLDRGEDNENKEIRNKNMQFFDVKSSDELISALISLAKTLELERLEFEKSYGRILASDITSPINLPDFNRSTMDGFAVRARDSFGASSSSPTYLELVGEVLMGESTELSLRSGETVKIATGGMLPQNADAVVMVEDTNMLDEYTVEINKSVAPYENTVQIGEDLQKGELILQKGEKIRPQDIGALAGLGITSLDVYRKPVVSIISTGDEIVLPYESPKNGQIRDINSYSLYGLILQADALPLKLGIVSDNEKELKSALESGLESSDVILISGGSSVGTRDVTLKVIQSFNDVKVLAHGVSVKPGKPTIATLIGDKFVFGMPGNPVSVMIIFDIFVKPVLQKMQGIELPSWHKHSVKAKMKTNLSSDAGRDEYIRVSLNYSDNGELIAEPIFGKSALISTMVKADGTVMIPTGIEGIEADEEVIVYLFE